MCRRGVKRVRLEASSSPIANSTGIGVNDGGCIVVAVGVEGNRAQTVTLGRWQVLGEAEWFGKPLESDGVERAAAMEVGLRAHEREVHLLQTGAS